MRIYITMEAVISTCQKTMSTNTKILELRKFFNIDDDKQWQQIWMDATKIYEAGISEVESSVKSWAKLSKIHQEVMIHKVRIFIPFNIDD